METSRSGAVAPLVAPAAALVAGTALGLTAVHCSLGAAVALALAGIALGGRRGALVAALALGLLSGRVREGPAPGAWLPDPERPVAAVGVVTGHGRHQGPVRPGAGGGEGSWSVPFRVERLTQSEPAGAPGGRRVRTRPLAVRLVLPADGPAPPLGSRVRVRGYLARPAPLANTPPTPPGPPRLKVKSRRLLEAVAPPGPVAGRSAALRARVEEALAALDPDPAGRPPGGRRHPALGAPVARALLLGDPGALPPPVVRGLRRLGLGHLLAVSGLHVGLAAALALLVSFPLPRRLRLLAVLGAVGLYLLLVGPRPSLLRAAAMAVLAVGALLAERPPAALNSLAAAAAAMVLAAPALVADLGFRLTVSATAALLLLAPRLVAAWAGGGDEPVGEPPAATRRRSARWLAAPLAASVSAQVGTMTFALPAFHLLPLAAPLANLVAVPWAAAAIAVAAAWLAAALVAPPLAGLLAPALELVSLPVAWPARLPASPWLALPVAVGPWTAVAVAGLAALAAVRPRRCWPLAGAVALLLVPPPGGEPDGRSAWPAGGGDEVTLTAIDVGQGDALLLADRGRAMLVDGGGWPAGDLGGRVLLPVLAGRGRRRLDAVLVTHPDRDHCGGLVDLGGYLDLGEVLTGPGQGSGSACAEALVELPGVGHRTVAAGDRWRVGRWRIEVLHPAAGAAAARGGDGDNDASVVVRAEAFGRRVLLTGDVEAAAEREILDRHPPEALAADLLKVAHHGSRTSTTPAFLAAVRPRLAIVSAGWNNPYRHPAPEVVARLAAARATVLRTDRQGMVRIGIRPDGTIRLALPAREKGRGAP